MSTLSNDVSGFDSSNHGNDSSLAGDSADEIPATTKRALREDDELVFPMSKAAFTQYWEDKDTPRELRVFYKDKEIAFDDPTFFSFGENLVKQSTFRAGDALQWCASDWPKVREMLED